MLTAAELRFYQTVNILEEVSNIGTDATYRSKSISVSANLRQNLSSRSIYFDQKPMTSSGTASYESCYRTPIQDT